MTIIEAEAEFVKLLPESGSDKLPPPELRNAAMRWAEMVWVEAEARGPVFLSQSQIEQGFKLIENPVYICGARGSGATLLHNLLDGHPQLVVLPSEGCYHTYFEPKVSTSGSTEMLKFFATEWMCRMVNPSNHPPYWLLGTSSTRFCPYVDFGRYLQVWWAAVPRSLSNWPHLAVVLAYTSATNKLTVRYWVDETSGNECFLKQIWTANPRAKVIQLVGEPSSILSDHQKRTPFNIRNSLKELKRSFQIAAINTGDERFLLIRNEDLCQDNSKAATAVTKFLDIEDSPALQNLTVAGKSVMKRIKAPGNAISSTEKKLLDAFMGNETRKLNYPAERVKPWARFFLKLRYGLFTKLHKVPEF